MVVVDPREATMEAATKEDRVQSQVAEKQQSKEGLCKELNTGIAEVLRCAPTSEELSSQFLAEVDPIPSSNAPARMQDLGPGAYFTSSGSGHLVPAGKTPMNVLGAELRLANKPGLMMVSSQGERPSPTTAPVQPRQQQQQSGESDMDDSDDDSSPPPNSPFDDPEQTRVSNVSNLTVANPVDENEILSTGNLPTAEEYDPESNTVAEPKSQGTYQPIYWAVGVLVVCAIVLLLVFALYKDEEVPVANNISSVVPTMAPTEFHLPSHVLGLLPEHAQLQIQQNPTSSQARAYAWLLEDPSVQEYLDAQIQQRFALATLYYATTGDMWTSNANWLNHSIHECNWEIMSSFAMKDALKFIYPGYLTEFFPGSEPPPTTCNDHGLFQHLWLDQNNLVGSLPEELYMLTNLKTLSVGLNRLEGTLSTRIGEMTAMEGLAIYYLRNAGTIPSEVGLLSNLRGIGLNDNDHTGTVPKELFSLTNLQTFSLSRNPDLKFTIPTEIGHFTKLRWFTPDDSTLHGTLPSEIGLARNLEFLALGGSELIGTLPSEMGSLTKLGYTSFHENSMHGTIPTEFGLLSNLYLISFRANDFSGTVPSEFGKLTSLRLSLNFDDNPLLSGTIPTELGLLTHLNELAFLNNNHSGPIPSELGRLTALERLTFGNNSLSGTIPSELSSLGQNLYTLEIQGNAMLYGTIPPALCTINGTCSGLAMNECYHHVSGLDFDCTSLLCGCGCPCSNVESGDGDSP